MFGVQALAPRASRGGARQWVDDSGSSVTADGFVEAAGADRAAMLEVIL